MIREDINQIFIALGWTRYRDEVGDSVLIKRIENRILDFVVFNNEFEIELNVSLSTDNFDKFDHIVGDRNVNYYTKKVINRRYVEGSVICHEKFRIVKRNYTADDVINLYDQILDWGLKVDIEAALSELRALPISSLGAMPVRHMAALAIAGDVETLGHYRDRFAAGDRMDCVPYITIDYITRALELAEKRKADPNWMPDKPKIRV